jgi:hypothetical protein
LFHINNISSMEQLVQERIEQRDRVAKATFELPDIQVSDRMKNISVLGLVADRSACGYYRIINPLHMLKMHGAKVNYASSHSLESFITHDVIVAPRQHGEEVYETYRFAGWENRLLVYEIDDDLDSVLPSSPAYITYHPGSPELKMISKFMKHSHGITTTTPEIARWYYQHNRNVSVIENYIDLSFRNWGADVQWDVDGLPIIRPNPINKPREWEGKTVIMYQGGTCWDAETEVLTTTGWIKAPLVTKEHEIATLNPDTDHLEYHKPSEVVSFDWNGDMHHYKNQQVDMLITPNHWTWSAKFGKNKSKAKFEKIQSQELFGNKFWAKKDCIWNQKSIDKIFIPGATKAIDTAEWVEFFGYWLGDGWTSKNQRQVGICQYKNNDILLRVEEILTKAGFTITKRPNEVLVCQKEFGNFMTQFGNALTKHIPFAFKNLSSSYLSILLNAYIQTDGNIEKSGRVRAWTSSPQLADDLTEVALKIGWAANVYTRPSKNGLIEGRVLKSSGPSHQINFLRSKVATNFLMPLVKEKDQSVVHYEGKVYCVTVKNHLVYTRRNGKACWTHNTHQEDMIQLGPEIKKVLEENDNVLFAMYVAVEMYAEFVHRFKLPEDKVTHVKATHFLEHPGGLHGADIQLAPIVACQFNMAKSHLKVLEGMAVGSAVVASHVGPYAKFVRRHPGSFLTVGTGAGCFRTWYEALTYLLKNPDELKRMQIAGRQLIYSQYCLEKNFHRWPESWIAIKERVDIGEVGPPDLPHPKDWYKSYGKAGRNDPCPCGSGEKYKSCCDGAFG